jgi:hypothetical protein
MRDHCLPETFYDMKYRSATFLLEKSTGAPFLIRHAKNVFRRALCFEEETRSLFGTVICQKSFVISLSMIDASEEINSFRSRVRHKFKLDNSHALYVVGK